jgi:hypothetical protein
MTLTVKQIDLISKYFAAHNVGTILEKKRGELEPLDVYIRRFWFTAVDNHDSAGVDIGPEALAFVKELRNPKKAGYWVDQFKKEFGENALAEIC